jgi:hypothetical protein
MAESPQVGFRLEERQQIMDGMRHSAEMPRISEPVNWLICYLPIYSDTLAVECSSSRIASSPLQITSSHNELMTTLDAGHQSYC